MYTSSIEEILNEIQKHCDEFDIHITSDSISISAWGDDFSDDHCNTVKLINEYEESCNYGEAGTSLRLILNKLAHGELK